MSNVLIDDNIWEELYTTYAPVVPFDAMSALMEKCRESSEAEQELLEELEGMLNDKEEDWDEERRQRLHSALACGDPGPQKFPRHQGKSEEQHQ